MRLIQSSQGSSARSLLKSLAAGMFEEVGIDLAGDAVAVNVDAASSRVIQRSMPPVFRSPSGRVLAVLDKDLAGRLGFFVRELKVRNELFVVLGRRCCTAIARLHCRHRRC